MPTISIQDWAAIITILSAILAAIYFMINWYKNKQKRYRQLLTGEWANGDSIGEPSQTHYFKLSLHADEEDGTVVGSLEITELGNDNHAIFSLNGNINYKSVKLTTTIVRHGEARHYDIVKVKVLNKRNLSLKSASKPSDFFPSEESIMWRNDPQPVVHY